MAKMQPSQPARRPKPAFVLVHSPLVGPYTWSAVAEQLRHGGYRASTPSLAGCEPPYWRAHAGRIVRAVPPAADRCVLVGHSGAGPLLPIAASQFEPPAACVYVDAMLPTGGQSRLASIPQESRTELFMGAHEGMAPPWGEGWPGALWERLIPDPEARRHFRSELMDVPLVLYDEPLPEPAAAPPSAYLQFSEAYNAEAERARSRGWPFERLRGEHLQMLAEPRAVAGALVRLAASLA